MKDDKLKVVGVKDLFPDFPDNPVDGYKVSVWYYDVSDAPYGRVYLTKVTWEFHVNTPYQSLHPDEPRGVAFTNQWCIRHNDKPRYEGRMREGWDEIFRIKGIYFLTKTEAALGALHHTHLIVMDLIEKLDNCYTCMTNLVSGGV